MTKIYIAGVAMTKMGRLDGATVKSLTCEAVDGAMADLLSRPLRRET